MSVIVGNKDKLCKSLSPGMNCSEFMKRDEYRKPDWLVAMEAIKERLAGLAIARATHLLPGLPACC